MRCEEGNMLYWVAGTFTGNDLVESIKYPPEVFLAASAEQARQKAIIRWKLTEDDLEAVEVYVCPFRH